MIRREIIIFLIVGTLSTLIDFLTYHYLLWLDLLTLNTAKAIGFLIGTVFAYFANRIWTFGHKHVTTGSAYRFALLYSLTLGMNVVVNNLVLEMFQHTHSSILIAFLIATASSAVLNFFGMKLFAFKENLIRTT